MAKTLEKDTEAKIKEAAREIFLERGYAGTRTRDIAEKAGINLALLNYYFRSKQKLFDLIMMESIQQLFSGFLPILNDESTSMYEKMVRWVELYIDLLLENPSIPSFILNAVKDHPEEFVARLGLLPMIKDSYFFKQFAEARDQGLIPAINPLQLLLNLIGLTVFPFISKPLVSTVTGMQDEEFRDLMEERKKQIPVWINAMLQTS